MQTKKTNILTMLTAISLLFLISGCGGNPPSEPVTKDNSSSYAAAERALAEMEGRKPNPTPQTISTTQPITTPTPQAQAKVVSGSRPKWVDNPEVTFSRSHYVTGVGNGASRDVAEKNALTSLISFFGVSIQSDQTVRESYNEAIKSGNMANWSNEYSMDSKVNTKSSMDELIGADIREVWQDSKSNLYYAVAVMEKSVAGGVYRDLILANQEMINNLLNMSQEEKYSINGYTRYSFAAVIADMNITHGNLLNLIGSVSPVELVRGDTYRLELQDIAKAINIEVNVLNDKSNRIKSAITKVISDQGFRTGASNISYVCDVQINVSPVELPNNQNKFARIELSANLIDKVNDVVLFNWSFNDRQGHQSMPEAENRVYASAERKINEEFKNTFSKYLSQLIPKK